MNDKGEIVGLENSREITKKIPNKIRNIMGITADVNLLKSKEDDKTYINVV
jgi:ATP-dependent DNA helicase RecG